MKAKILNQMIPKQLGNSDSRDTREDRDVPQMKTSHVSRTSTHGR